MSRHELAISRFPRGKTPIRPTRIVYGTRGVCSCGWTGRDNSAPSKGGRNHVRSFHTYETGEKATIRV